MALTPDTPDAPNEAFLREVDEDLRRDRMRDFGTRYGKWIIIAVVLFLAAIGGWLYWQNEQRERAATQSEELNAIYNDIGAGNAEAAQRRLQPLKEANNDVVRALALLTEAAIALESNNRNTAIANYRTVANGDFPEPYQNLALIRATTLEFDSLEPQAVIDRLEPLTNAGDPWFASAGELTAMAHLKAGRNAQAGRLFATIAADETAPESARSRAAQIAGTLGVDATASLANGNEQE